MFQASFAEHSHNTCCFSCTTAFSETKLIFPKELFCFCWDSLCKNFQNNFRSIYVFIVLKSLHSVAFAFFSIGTTVNLLKSSGHSPLLYICLHSSTSSSVAFSPRLFIISAEMLSIPVLFLIFISLIAILISLSRREGPCANVPLSLLHSLLLLSCLPA